MTDQTVTREPAAAERPDLLTSLRKQILSGERPYALYAAFLALIVGFSIASPVFFSVDNFANIGRQTALVTIIAVGMTLVIISGEIDLSVGSVLALSGMMAALTMQHVANNWLLGAVVGLATGAVAGLVNGLLTTRLGIPSFLVTLGTLSIGAGVALTVTHTQPVIITNDAYSTFFGVDIAGLPAPIVWTVIALIGGILLLHFSTFGRKVYATGGNTTAARYSGIKTGNVKTIAFVLTGVLAGLAALILTGQSQAARPDFAGGLELDVIAATILGGTSLFGGSGTIVGTLIGSLLIGILNNGLVLVGVGSSVQEIIKGAIIIIAVAFVSRRR
jgi:ribose transport system permease protein